MTENVPEIPFLCTGAGVDIIFGGYYNQYINIYNLSPFSGEHEIRRKI